MIQINEDSTVVMNFVLKGENGQTAMNTYDDTPVKFSMGDGSFSEAFQNAVMGLSTGDKKTIVLETEDGFGAANPKNIHQFAKSEFKQGVPEVGEVVEFTQAGNQKLYGIVKAVSENDLTIDFNHPLAGQRLTFEVEIMDVLATMKGGCCGHDHGNGEHKHYH